MKPTDVALTTTAGKQTSVLDLLDEMRGCWPKGDDARARARMMEQLVYNRVGGKSLALEGNVSLPMNVPPVSKNKLRSSLLTWASRTTKRRDTALAWANESTPGDLARAEVANAVLDYQRQLQDRDALMMRAMILAGMHGMVGLYNTWDPDHGPHKEREVVLDRFGLPAVDPETGETIYNEVEGRGAPNLEILTIFDFITSGEKETQDGKWLLVRRWLDVDEAASLLRAKTEELRANAAPGEPIADLEPSTEKVQSRSGSGPSREAVESYEMWWRPNAHGRLAEGLFAAVVSGYVVAAQPFPYEHGELPLLVIRTMDVEDDFYGASWLEDAIPQQLGLNHSLRVLAHRAEVAGQVRMLMKKSVAQAWGDSPDGVVELDSDNDVQNGVRPAEVPGIPKDMYEMVDRYERGIDDTAGVSAVASSGDVAAETKNARLVAYATQVDEQKNEHTLRNLQEAEVAVDAQELELYKQYVTRQRLVRIIGEDRAISAGYFAGAEVRGVDIRLEPAPGSERTRAARGKDAEESAAAGYLDPGRAAEMRQTGLQGTVDEGEQRMRTHALIQQALMGRPVQADMTIDPDVAVRELRMAIERAAPEGARVVMPLRALLQEYMELASQGAQQAMPQQPQGKAGVTGQDQQQNQLPGGAM